MRVVKRGDTDIALRQSQHNIVEQRLVQIIDIFRVVAQIQRVLLQLHLQNQILAGLIGAEIQNAARFIAEIGAECRAV